VHEYTKTLYRCFGVNSRAELLAQFVTAPGTGYATPGARFRLIRPLADRYDIQQRQ
jgi:hypothetical protein